MGAQGENFGQPEGRGERKCAGKGEVQMHGEGGEILKPDFRSATKIF